MFDRLDIVVRAGDCDAGGRLALSEAPLLDAALGEVRSRATARARSVA